MADDRLHELIADYCADQLSEEDADELMRMVESDAQAMELLTRARITDKGLKAVMPPVDEEQAWRKIERQMSPRRIPVRRKRRLAVGIGSAAAVIIAGLVSYLALNMPNTADDTPVIVSETMKAILHMPGGQSTYLDEDRAGVEIAGVIEEMFDPAEARSAYPDEEGGQMMSSVIVPRNGYYDFFLPDGTHVYLNSESEVKFNSSFDGATREIYVSGEAFLDVAKDARRPFIVHTEQSATEVLGTSFNVSAYPDDERVMVTLVSGSVEFNASHYREKLEPNEQIVWGAQTDYLTKRAVNVSTYTSWITGLYQFEKTPLREIANHLARRYDVNFVFESEVLGDYLFTGSSHRDENIEVVLRDISMTTDIDFTIKGKEVIVKKKA